MDQAELLIEVFKEFLTVARRLTAGELAAAEADGDLHPKPNLGTVYREHVNDFTSFLPAYMWPQCAILATKEAPREPAAWPIAGWALQKEALEADKNRLIAKAKPDGQRLVRVANAEADPLGALRKSKLEAEEAQARVPARLDELTNQVGVLAEAEVPARLEALTQQVGVLAEAGVSARLDALTERVEALVNSLGKRKGRKKGAKKIAKKAARAKNPGKKGAKGTVRDQASRATKTEGNHRTGGHENEE
jgi:hypothetical protein